MMAFNHLFALLKYLKLCKIDLVIVVVALACVSASLLSLGQAFKILIDHGLSGQEFLTINRSILLICILIVVFGISSFFRAYTINNVAEKITGKIRADAFTNLINYEIAYFEDEKVGNIISKLTGDLELVTKLIVNFLSFFTRNSIMLCGAIICMFLQSYKLSLIVIITVPVILIPILKLGKYVRSLSKEALNSESILVSDLIESFTYIQTIFAYNQQENKISNFKKLLDNNLKQTSKRLKIRSLFFALTISVILMSITFVIWVGSNDILKGQMSSGEMISFIYYAIIAGFSAGGIAELLSEIHSPIAALERIFELPEFESSFKLNLKSERHEILTSYRNLNVEFQDVSFSYSTIKGVQVLKDISFKINAGSFIGIIGPSGAGKSTIMRSLLKFYPNMEGHIFFNGQDIDNINAKEIRKLIAYVPQEPSIFSGSIKSNIAFSNPTASNEAILKVASVTGIMDFAQHLPNDIDTEIGERGVKLSGGQRQRIAIARALLYNPEILLLDEATSSIDDIGEKAILLEIRNVMQGKIIISIAHRASSLENADEILVVDKGRIVAQGTHNNLVKESTFYNNFLEKN